MVFLMVAGSAVIFIVAPAVIVLVRRERRRMDSSPEALQIEAGATRAHRNARRQAQAYQHFNDGSGVRALRDRD
jgi:hypothetical protein